MSTKVERREKKIRESSRLISKFETRERLRGQTNRQNEKDQLKTNDVVSEQLASLLQIKRLSALDRSRQISAFHRFR